MLSELLKGGSTICSNIKHPEELKDIMQSKIIQTQKKIYNLSHIYIELQLVHIRDVEKKWNMLAREYQISVDQGKICNRNNTVLYW